MKKFTNVLSTAPEVQPIEYDAYHVYINNGITAVKTDDFTGFEIAEQIVYDKDEYIAKLSEEKSELEGTVNSILTDVLPNLMEV